MCRLKAFGQRVPARVPFNRVQGISDGHPVLPAQDDVNGESARPPSATTLAASGRIAINPTLTRSRHGARLKRFSRSIRGTTYDVKRAKNERVAPTKGTRGYRIVRCRADWQRVNGCAVAFTRPIPARGKRLQERPGAQGDSRGR